MYDDISQLESPAFYESAQRIFSPARGVIEAMGSNIGMRRGDKNRSMLLISLIVACSSLFGCQTTQNRSDSSSLPPVKPFNDVESFKNPNVQIIAFGDFGRVNRKLQETMNMYHGKFKSPDAVFLLGDNSYQPISDASEYDSYFLHVARQSRPPHYVILGNHDYQYEADGFELEISKRDSRWIMPSRYYFERFVRAEFTICGWFLDTYKFTREQSTWLDKSISREQSTCTWTIVNGHHPGQVQASGAKFGSNHIDQYLQPILDKYDVDLYLCGHHHNSQHLSNLPYKTHVFVVGQVMSAHPFDGQISKGQLVWGTGTEPSILELNITKDSIDYAFHSGSRGPDGSTIHSGTIVHD